MVVWLVVATWLLVGSLIGWRAMKMMPEEDRETFLFVGLVLFWPMMIVFAAILVFTKAVLAVIAFMEERWP